MTREKFERLAAAHRDDDREEAIRFRSVPDLERARLFFSLCRSALAVLGSSPPDPGPRPAAAEAWWLQLVRRERTKHHA